MRKATKYTAAIFIPYTMISIVVCFLYGYAGFAGLLVVTFGLLFFLMAIIGVWIMLHDEYGDVE